MSKDLHPKIKKNILDLDYSSYLTKCHTIINIGLTFWVVLIGGVITWVFAKEEKIFTQGQLIFTMLGTSVLFILTLIFYLPQKINRNNIIRKIEQLNNSAKDL